MNNHELVSNPGNYEKFLEVQLKINKLLLDIKRGRDGLSAHHGDILNSPAFKELVAMGDKIVNYIMHLMLSKGAHWEYFYLLAMIVPNGINITKESSAGNMLALTIDWLTWYYTSDYYKNNDVYYGLVD